MPSYERWKSCGYRSHTGDIVRKEYSCKNIASLECMNSSHTHWDQFRNSPSGADYLSEETVDHPRFLCDEHEKEYGG